MTEPIKRLYRSRNEGQLAGICAGLGQYLGVDPVFLRVVVLAGTFVTGILPGVLTYLAVWMIVPQEPWVVQAPQAQPPRAEPPRADPPQTHQSPA